MNNLANFSLKKKDKNKTHYDNEMIDLSYNKTASYSQKYVFLK